MHFEQAKGLKPHFGPFLALNGLFFGQRYFSDLLPTIAATYQFCYHDTQDLHKGMAQNLILARFGPNWPILGPAIFLSTWTAIRY